MSREQELERDIQHFRQLLVWEQANHREFRREMYDDPVIGEILRLRREIKSREAFEHDLITEGQQEVEFYQDLLDDAERERSLAQA